MVGTTIAACLGLFYFHELQKQFQTRLEHMYLISSELVLILTEEKFDTHYDVDFIGVQRLKK